MVHLGHFLEALRWINPGHCLMHTKHFAHFSPSQHLPSRKTWQRNPGVSEFLSSDGRAATSWYFQGGNDCNYCNLLVFLTIKSAFDTFNFFFKISTRGGKFPVAPPWLRACLIFSGFIATRRNALATSFKMSELRQTMPCFYALVEIGIL